MNHSDMKQRDMIKLLEKSGWILVRKSKHLIYKKGQSIIAVTNAKIIKRNTVKQMLQIMESEA